MVVAADVGGTEFIYFCDDDRAAMERGQLTEAESTEWGLRTLQHHEQSQVEAMMKMHVPQDDRDPYMIFSTFDVACKVLEFGFVYVKRFRDRTGAEIDVSRDSKGRLPNEAWDRLRPYIHELANAITERSKLREEEAKNS